MKYKLLIHGHSCCEIRSDSFSLVCDPWLLGSAYWRSWWNFPKSESLKKLIKIWQNQPYFYIYLTHIHWDHFHGPTLKEIYRNCKNVKFLIPKVTEKRFKKDLQDVLKEPNIKELIHAKKYKLFNDINLLSYQSGPIITDSALSIFNDEFCILNMNDSKILPLSMKHLRHIIPSPDITLRSHSSANSRCCNRQLNGDEISSIDKKRFEYSKEFFEDCYNTGAKLAIPFASNMIHLHRETEKYNLKSNFSDYVVNDFESLKNNFKGMNCKLILPGEQINLENFKIKKDIILRKKIKNLNRKDLINQIKEEHITKLKLQEELEIKTAPSNIIIQKFFLEIINKTPIFLRIYFYKHIYIEAYSKIKTQRYRLDFISKKVELVDKIDLKQKTVLIKVSAYVLNNICRTKNYTSLGISKRLEIRKNPNNNLHDLFAMVCAAIEIDGTLPLLNLFDLRNIVIIIRRIRELIDFITYFAIRFFREKSLSNYKI